MKKYLGFLVLACMILSCAQKAKPVVAVVNDLSGIWQILTVNGTTVIKKDAGKEMPYLEFNTEKHTVTGTAGCNRLNGKATISSSSIDFGPMATTMMICPNAKYEIEILQTLRGNLSYTYEKGIISITKEGRTVLTLGR